MMSTDPIVELQGITRTFSLKRQRGEGYRRHTVTAVDDMTWSIRPGESVGYIGANGAGKSTTIKMLCGILVPTTGTVRTCGFDPVRQRRQLARHIGVVFGQRSQLWWDLPLADSFRLLAAIHRLPTERATSRTKELVDQLEMGDTLATPVRQLSLGQRMRAEVAAALLHSPALLILDEPTIGLDVVVKARLREFLLHERHTHGTTLLLTTHDMGDIERLCERVLVVDHGRVAYDGTLAGLAATVTTERLLVVDLAEPTADLTGLVTARFEHSEADGLRQSVAFDPATTSAAAVLAEIGTHAEVRDLSIAEPDIEDVVRRIYQSQAR